MVQNSAETSIGLHEGNLYLRASVEKYLLFCGEGGGGAIGRTQMIFNV